MNRKIKFRGKRVDNDKWIYGDLLTFNGDYEICDHNTIDGSRYDVIPETVGQFTGLQDENGREIYEGDIVMVIEMICTVEWNHDCCCWQYSNGEPINNGNTYGCTKYILGNIHEKRDLL